MIVKGAPNCIGETQNDVTRLSGKRIAMNTPKSRIEHAESGFVPCLGAEAGNFLGIAKRRVKSVPAVGANSRAAKKHDDARFHGEPGDQRLGKSLRRRKSTSEVGACGGNRRPDGTDANRFHRRPCERLGKAKAADHHPTAQKTSADLQRFHLAAAGEGGFGPAHTVHSKRDVATRLSFFPTPRSSDALSDPGLASKKCPAPPVAPRAHSEASCRASVQRCNRSVQTQDTDATVKRGHKTSSRTSSSLSSSAATTVSEATSARRSLARPHRSDARTCVTASGQ